MNVQRVELINATDKILIARMDLLTRLSGNYWSGSGGMIKVPPGTTKELGWFSRDDGMGSTGQEHPFEVVVRVDGQIIDNRKDIVRLDLNVTGFATSSMLTLRLNDSSSMYVPPGLGFAGGTLADSWTPRLNPEQQATFEVKVHVASGTVTDTVRLTVGGEGTIGLLDRAASLAQGIGSRAVDRLTDPKFLAHLGAEAGLKVAVGATNVVFDATDLVTGGNGGKRENMEEVYKKGFEKLRSAIETAATNTIHLHNASERVFYALALPNGLLKIADGIFSMVQEAAMGNVVSLSSLWGVLSGLADLQSGFADQAAINGLAPMLFDMPEEERRRRAESIKKELLGKSKRIGPRETIKLRESAAWDMSIFIMNPSALIEATPGSRIVDSVVIFAFDEQFTQAARFSSPSDVSWILTDTEATPAKYGTLTEVDADTHRKNLKAKMTPLRRADRKGQQKTWWARLKCNGKPVVAPDGLFNDAPLFCAEGDGLPLVFLVDNIDNQCTFRVRGKEGPLYLNFRHDFPFHGKVQADDRDALFELAPAGGTNRYTIRNIHRNEFLWVHPDGRLWVSSDGASKSNDRVWELETVA